MYAAVYVRVPLVPMRRTNIYLSESEQRGLDALAEERGSTRSDVLRQILDRELNLGSTDDSSLDDALADMASAIAQKARDLSASDPDLAIE